MRGRKRKGNASLWETAGRRATPKAQKLDSDLDVPLATGVHSLPDEMLVHILSCGALNGDKRDDVFLSVARTVAGRWRNAVSILWHVPRPHAYGRCLQFLMAVKPNALATCRSKPDVVREALTCARRNACEAGPHLLGCELRPYDYATSLYSAFYRSAGVTQREAAAERCPGCAYTPESCACVCDNACRDCGGASRLDDCPHVDRAHWQCDYPEGEDENAVDIVPLASLRTEKDARRHREATTLRWTRQRAHELSHWHALSDPLAAEVYLGRCVQLLVCYGLADAEDIARMSCAAVIRRAHCLDDYRTHRGRPRWKIPRPIGISTRVRNMEISADYMLKHPCAGS
ncbi:hypothetical protein pmac_cds_619 [Pandoravirus macleodensis]|uniref:Uncharacterized protein n=1 Tax=Pandoravirus macleodensis TaxID=2107707 RepID=A0A2U7UFQ6_9VIRU|nr:hypothetical protein pmac_cds_619 [Pandoravirus macleodensis]AVK77307.1 hypothetical protein pmac_cds_619 [Pandoravirus macleodensis]